MKTRELLSALLFVSILSQIFSSSAKAEVIEVGAAAPALSVVTDAGKTIQLAEAYATGPVLVYFYPKADTPGCTSQACNLRDNFVAVQDAGVTVFGVSTDKVESQAAFKEKYHLPFTLIADTEGALCDAYGVERKGGIFATRQSFLIIDGKVAWRDLSATPASQAEDALAALKAATAKKSNDS